MRYSFAVLFHLIIMGAIIAAAVRAEASVQLHVFYCISYVIASAACSNALRRLLDSRSSEELPDDCAEDLSGSDSPQSTSALARSIITVAISLIYGALLIWELAPTTSEEQVFEFWLIGAKSKNYLLLIATLLLACSLRPQRIAKNTRFLLPFAFEFITGLICFLILLLLLLVPNSLWLIYIATKGIEMGLSDPFWTHGKPEMIDSKRAFSQAILGFAGVILWALSAACSVRAFHSHQSRKYLFPWLFLVLGLACTIAQFLALGHDFPLIKSNLPHSHRDVAWLDYFLLLMLSSLGFAHYTFSNGAPASAPISGSLGGFKSIALGLAALLPVVVGLIVKLREGIRSYIFGFAFVDTTFILLACMGVVGLQLIARRKTEQTDVRCSSADYMHVGFFALVLPIGTSLHWFVASFYISAAQGLFPMSIWP